MPVFNLCLKIIKKKLPVLSIYLVVFLAISIIITGTATRDQKEINSFTPAKVDLAFISEEETPLIKGLRDELSKLANFVDISFEKEALQDALYFREITSVIHIESGFTEKFLAGEEVSIKTSTIPGSYSAVYLEMNIDQYLNTAKLYAQLIDGISQEELVRYVKEDLTSDVNIRMLGSERENNNTDYSVYYFNYLAYSLLAILIMGIGTVMVVFNDKDIQMRNNSSPYSVTAINIQVILALFTFTLLSWFVMVFFSFALNFQNSLNKNTIYFLINSLVFTFTGTGISFLIGSVFKSQDAIGAISNVLTLGTSFISGVFVPQEFLGDFVLKIASFTPTYWYVTANNQIGSLSQFDFSNLKPSLYCMVIQICFGIFFFALGIILSKRKKGS